MKSLLLAILLLTAGLVPAQRDLTNIQIKMDIKSGLSNSVDVYYPNREGYILGALDAANPILLRHSEIIPDREIFAKSIDAFLIDSRTKPGEIDELTIRRIMEGRDSTFLPSGGAARILFSFTPLTETVKADSVKMLFKYVYYSPAANNTAGEFAYSIKYGSAICTMPYDAAADFNALKKIFPEVNIKLTAGILDFAEKQKIVNSQETGYVDLAYYKSTIKQIEESAKKSKVIAPGIKFSFEYIRTDKKNEQLILNKLSFPLPGSPIAITENEYLKFPSFIYRGTIKSPVELYEKEKNKLIKQSSRWRYQNFTYDVVIIPIEKKGEELVCDLYFPSSTLNPQVNCYKKTISFRLGERVKIALPPGHWYLSDKINGKDVVITEESFRNYVNEYFVMFAESFGDIIANAAVKDSTVKQPQTNYISKSYTVQYGNSLQDIAARLNVSVSELKAWNDLELGNKVKLRPGARLTYRIPVITKTYTVKNGDRIQNIAWKLDVTVNELKTWNNLGLNSSVKLKPGAKLIYHKPVRK